ncbi:putative beta-lactamase/transpeptidase [Septoria linicola]|nr:putative beta-lactamase/transpeptidase [Septoria linicola]
MGVLKDLETFVVSTGHLREEGIPSVSMAFLDDPLSPVQHHVMSRGEENAETVYQACSISKAITALAVAKLVDQGKMSYDTKVIDHIPSPIATAIVDDNTRLLLPLVTVGMLLSHRSGLSQHGFPGYVGEPANYQEIFSGKPPSNTPRIRFISLPGSQYSYSGGGFTLLQIVIERVTWMPFADFMRETVLSPLGMSRSRYGDTASGDNNYARSHVTAYTPGTSSPRGYFRFTELAAAGLWTTPTDLLKAIAAIQRSLFSKTGFLTPSTAREMLTLAAPNDSKSHMGLGWTLDETFFAHSGQNDPGYTCYVLGAHRINDVPKTINNPRLMSLAIMTNSSLGWDTIKKLVVAIFTFRAWPLYDSLIGWKMTDFPPYTAPEGINPGDKWKDFLGHWTAAATERPPLSGLASRQQSQPGTPDTPTQTLNLVDSLTIKDGEWEIYEDGGQPMLAWDGVDQAMRLRPGAAPWLRLDGRADMTFVVDGLKLAIRMCSRSPYQSSQEPVNFLQQSRGIEDMWIELVQEQVTILRKV